MKARHAAQIRYGIHTAWSYLYRMHLDHDSTVAGIIFEMQNAPRATRKAFCRTVRHYA